jgi:ATP-dependent DNA helicase RecG
MDYLANHEEITNRVARELTGISSENTMKLVFLRLAARNLIERIPGRRGPASAWRKRIAGSEKDNGGSRH